MCGIAGFSGEFDPAVASRLGAAMRHRGPDDAGEWHSADGRIGFAHRRLSIIDVSASGHQPMIDATSTAVIVFNGEIYNYRELRADLMRHGHVFRTQTDTEVLLALYRSAGEAMLRQLNGIFAFAIFDTRSDTLLVAGDEFAVKPLYFSQTRQGFIFASELKALVASGAIDAELDVSVFLRTLGYLWSPGGATPLKGVERLGPGEALQVRNSRILRRWRWADASWTGPRHEGGAADATTEVRTAVRTAVHRQLVADVPVGAFLSGGLDSSAIVAMAREAAPGIECFTIDTGDDRDSGVTDDLPYARKAAAHLGVRLHEIRVDAARIAEGLESMIGQLDEPLADPAPLNVFFISELARQAGIKVLLSGAGGDDIFSGYRRHRALVAEQYWAPLPVSVRRTLRRVTGGMGQQAAFGRRLAKAFAHGDLPADRRLPMYFLWADESRIRGLFTEEHRESLRTAALDAPMQAYLVSLPADLAPLDRMLALEQRFFLADHNLLYTDKMGMAAGVEIRVPFLDPDLVRLANRLPAHFKQRGRHGKWILKRAMEGMLPDDIIHRPKTGFGAPVRQWLRQEWRELMHDTLSRDSLTRRGIFDVAAVSRLVEDHRSGRVDAAYVILSLMCCELWCRRFLSSIRQAPAAVAAAV